MNIQHALISVEASGSIGSSVSGTSQPVWRNILPCFVRDINTTAVDAAHAARLTPIGATDTFLFDNFPNVEMNGDTLITDGGQALIMLQMSLLVIRVGKLDTESAAAGDVTITVNDIFGAHSRTLTNGDMVLQEIPPFALLSSSFLRVAFSGDADNLCADVFLLGAKTALPDS